MKKRYFPKSLLCLLLFLSLILSGCDDDDYTKKHSAPNAPTGLKAAAISDSSISISWNAVSDADKYSVYFASGSSTTKNFLVNTSNTSYTHTGLSRGIRYTYYITAINSYGDESEYSSAASATTQESMVYKTFWVQDYNYNYYQLEAVLLFEGSYCNVFVEKGSENKTTAQKVANEFDKGIYPKMNAAFGIPLTYNDKTFSGPMEFADWMGDGDGKLIILLLNLRSIPGISFLGYFLYEDLISEPDFKYSNYCDIIYLDINTLDNTTVAHEMQHMMNFVTGYALRGEDGWMDAWIDEGLSSAAEWIYSGRHNRDRIDWFNRGSGLIDLGNNFFVWENHIDENPEAVLDDYATVYLFFQWLRLQANNSAIYKSIIASEYYDEKAVTTAMNSFVPGQGYNVWGTLLKTWLAANYINAPSGPYGYKDDPALKLETRTVPAKSGNTLKLAPGEAVYSVTKTAPTLTGQGRHIKNTFLNPSGKEVRDTPYYPNGTMITYNINTDIYEGDAETGRIMASIADSDIITIAEKRSVEALHSIPFRIDASRFFRQEGNGRNRF